MNGFTESISLPVCFGGAIDVFWDSAGTVHVETGPEELALYANDPALESLAKQMLYFAGNNSLGGFHVHYDSFFCKAGHSGKALTLEFSGSEEANGFDLYDGDTIELSLEIPYHFGDSGQIVPGRLLISPDEARITGDEKALLYLTKTLLALRHEKPGSVRQIHSGRTVLRIVYCHTENGRNINDCL